MSVEIELRVLEDAVLFVEVHAGVATWSFVVLRALCCDAWWPTGRNSPCEGHC